MSDGRHIKKVGDTLGIRYLVIFKQIILLRSRWNHGLFHIKLLPTSKNVHFDVTSMCELGTGIVAAPLALTCGWLHSYEAIPSGYLGTCES